MTSGVLLVGSTAAGDLVPVLVNPDGSLAGVGGGGGGGTATDVSALNKETSQQAVLTALGGTGTLHTDLAALLSNSAQATSIGTSLAALNAAVNLTPGRKGTAIFQVTGTFSGTLSLAGNLDGANYVTMNATPQFLNLNTGAYTATITGPGLYQTSLNGLVNAQLKMTAFTSGAAIVSSSLTDAPAMVALDAAIPAGANLIGAANIMVGGVAPALKASGAAPATTDTALVAAISPNSYAAAQASSISSAATTNATAVKTSGANLFTVTAINTSATVAYLKLYNKASAPTVGTDVPVDVLTIPAAVSGVPGRITEEYGQQGKRFATGLALAITGLATDGDATAVTTGIRVHSTFI